MNNRIIQLLVWLLFALLVIVGTALVQHRFCCAPQALLPYAEDPVRLLHLLNGNPWAWVLIGIGLILAADRLVHAAWNFVLPVLLVASVAEGLAFLPSLPEYLPPSAEVVGKYLPATVRGWSILGLCYLPVLALVAYLFARRGTRLLICTLIATALWVPAVWGCEWLTAQWAAMPEPFLPNALHTVQACPWLCALLPGCTLLLFCELMSFYEAALPAAPRKVAQTEQEAEAPQATSAPTTPAVKPATKAAATPAAAAAKPAGLKPTLAPARKLKLKPTVPSATAAAAAPAEEPAEEVSETTDPAPVETPAEESPVETPVEEAPAETPTEETEVPAEIPAEPAAESDKKNEPPAL